MIYHNKKIETYFIDGIEYYKSITEWYIIKNFMVNIERIGV